MTIAKRLMISAVTSLALGVGTAMAQEGGQDYQTPYWTQARQIDVLRVAQARSNAQVQAGSSDVERSGAHVLPFNGDFSDLANPG